MKYPGRSLLAAVAVLATFVSHAAAIPVAVESHAALAAFDTAYRQCLLQGSVVPAAGYLSENVRLMPEFQRTVLGRDNTLSYYRAFAERFSVQAYQRESLGEIDLGSHLVAAGRFTEKLARKSDGREYELIGKYVDLWAKSADGKLQLVTQAWNYDRHVEIGDELRFAAVPAIVAAFQRRAPIDSNVTFELAALGHLLELAVSQHDARLFARFYADDAILLPNYHTACVGRQAIDAYADSHLPQLSVFEKLDIRSDRIDVLDGYVIEYASHVANWKNGDSSGVNTGKNLRIWRREPDHALKVIVQLGAYD